MVNEPAVVIRLQNVTKRYGSRLVLDDVSVAVRRGETIALLGPSGGGKSTLLRCVNGLHAIDSGEVHVGPHVLSADGVRQAAVLSQVRRFVGMVFQDFQLFPHLTALGNLIEGPCCVLRMSADAARLRAMELLDRVGLADRADAYPQQLSGGQKQRVAIARALAMQPQALLCDEITSALDPELKHEVLEVIEDLKRDGMTLMLVTHEIGFARRAADRILVLGSGKLLEDGPPEQVLDRPQHPRTQQFLKRVMA